MKKGLAAMRPFYVQIKELQVVQNTQHFCRSDDFGVLWKMFQVSRDKKRVICFVLFHCDFKKYDVFGVRKIANKRFYGCHAFADCL